MIREILTIARVKVWFATVNVYKEAQARRALAKYMKTISPKNREYALKLRAALDEAKNSGQAVQVLRKESERLSNELHRVTERTAAVTRV
jgi:hypothetical protein